MIFNGNKTIFSSREASAGATEVEFKDKLFVHICKGNVSKTAPAAKSREHYKPNLLENGEFGPV